MGIPDATTTSSDINTWYSIALCCSGCSGKGRIPLVFASIECNVCKGTGKVPSVSSSTMFTTGGWYYTDVPSGYINLHANHWLYDYVFPFITMVHDKIAALWIRRPRLRIGKVHP